MTYLEGRTTGTSVSELAYMLANEWEDDLDWRNTKEATRAQMVSVRRAIHNLHARGLIEVAMGWQRLSLHRRQLAVRLHTQDWPGWLRLPLR